MNVLHLQTPTGNIRVSMEHFLVFDTAVTNEFGYFCARYWTRHEQHADANRRINADAYFGILGKGI